MATPRIPPIEPPYETDIADAFDRIMPPGHAPLTLFRTMARNPRVLRKMFAGGLLDKGSITLRDRELMILRTCARCGSEYEWGVHVAFFAKHAGLSKEHIAATLNGALPDNVSERDALLIRMADALHESANISDALWHALEQVFSAEQLLELIALAGYYRTISMMTNACRIDLEPFAARFADA